MNSTLKWSRRLLSLFLSITMVISLLSISCFAAGSGQKWNLGTLTKTGLDNGYSGDKKIDNKDPHYGWDLGQFYVSGFTQRTTDSKNSDVFLKNVGDKVELHFELLQDIDCLNGDKNLSVNVDRNPYDQYFKTQKFNDCRGLLIIRKTDYQNKAGEPVIYKNYLDGVKQGADTVVELCEEGDYEVALDYELKLEHYGTDWNTKVSIPTYTNYRIFFTFKIRNGNCMVFPFDTKTGSELTNEAFTSDGFYLDLANSRYLEINVKRTVYAEKEGGYTEDVRFNRPAADGTQYTDEGVYTITVKNLFTEQTTTKVIYVGSDPVMKAYAVTGLSLKEIKQKLEEGYTITDKGTLVDPSSGSNSDETTAESNTSNETAAKPSETNSTANNVTEPTSNKKGGIGLPVIIVIVILIVGAGVFVFIKKDSLFGKKNDVSQNKADSSNEEKKNNEVIEETEITEEIPTTNNDNGDDVEVENKNQEGE